MMPRGLDSSPRTVVAKICSHTGTTSLTVRTLSKATMCPTTRAMMSARARAMPSTSQEALEARVGAKASAEEAKALVEEAKASAEEAKATAEVVLVEVTL